MAGDWLKMEASTPEKGEVLALTARMGWDDADLTVGKLFRLWRWFDQQTTDGNARGVTPALLDRIIGVTGFCRAVAEVGWLVIDDDGVRLPKFDRHNGSTAKSRAQTAQRVAKHKSNTKGNAQANAAGNAESVSEALPREEKRREESNTPQPPKGRSGAVSLKTWAEAVKARGEKLVPEDDPVFAYADQVGIPRDYLDLAWLAFKRRYTVQHPAKRYSDWRRVFRNAVEGNWAKLWFVNPDGSYSLTTVGHQAQRATREHMEAAA